MKSGAVRKGRTAPAPLLKSFLAVGLALGLLDSPVAAQVAPTEIQAVLKSIGKSGRELRAFYEARGNRPLWIQGSSVGPEAERLLELLRSAELDGLDPDDYKPRTIASAMNKAWGGSPKALAKAELLLSQALVEYIRDVRRPRDIGMLYVDPVLVPVVPTAAAVLQAAAAAPSLEQHLDAMGWMHPLYAQLRENLAGHYNDAPARQLLRLNLERARALPSYPGRHVLIDAAGARLWMYENGRVRDTMRVVVGKTDQQTPMMAGMIRYAIVNPYWNIPPDLVQTQVAAGVLEKGLSYFKTKRYQALSDWSDKPRVLDPAKVNWQSVAAGAQELRVRQLPGKNNAMGRVKFMFPNDLGIYLHDTPERELLRKNERQFSSGCVRLEDAQRFGRWLMGKPLRAKSVTPEQQVMLAEPVPVYITYLTAAPEGEMVAFRPDVYNRDIAQMERMRKRSFARR